MFRIRNIFFVFIAVLLFYFLFEGFCAAGLYLLEKGKHVVYNPRPRFYASKTLSKRHRKALSLTLKGQGTEKWVLGFDRFLGWTIQPSANQSSIRINAQGMRSSREYPLSSSRDKVRVAAFGDSFTFSMHVSYGSSWPRLLEAKDPRLEILNFGVPGYGLDQAYLRYQKEGKKFHPQVVLLGYFSENIERHVNVFRPFYTAATGLPFSKPRFYLDGKRLVLRPNYFANIQNLERLLAEPARVLPELGRYDYFYKIDYRKGRMDFLPSVRFFKITRKAVRERLKQGPIFVDGIYNESSEAYRVTTEIFRIFYEAVRTEDSVPVIVVFPTPKDWQRVLEGQERSYAPLLLFFQKQGYAYVDMLDELTSRRPGEPVQHFLADKYHYNALGNRVTASAIIDAFRRKNIIESAFSA